MKRKLFPSLVIVALAVSVVLAAGCSGSTTTTTTTSPKTTPSTTRSTGGAASVSIVDFSFNPSTLTVSPGATVTWKNNGGAVHTVTGSGWDSGQLQPGAQYTHTFNTAGTYTYHCANHPAMTASITVQSGSSSGTSGTSVPNATTAPSNTTGY